jgi:hypothetical protein
MPGDTAEETGGISSPVYFSLRELGEIALLAILAVIIGIDGSQYLLNGEASTGIISEILNLSGPGAGIPLFGAVICFCLVLGMVVVKKPWTAIITSIIVIALILLLVGPVSIDSVDGYLFIAIIIEVAALLPVSEKPWKYLLPGILVLLAGFALARVLLGLGGTGGISTVATISPAGYFITAGLALCCAAICFYFPLKYLFGSGIANACFLMNIFLFQGRGVFASVNLLAMPKIPVIILAALVGGIFAAGAACEIEWISRYFSRGGTFKKR